MEQICNRKIRSTVVLERNDPGVREWFRGFIELLEKDAAIEQHKRLSVLREVFPRGILEHVISIITLESKDEKRFTIERTEDRTNIISVDQFPSSLSVGSQESSREVHKIPSKFLPKNVKVDRAAKRLFDYRQFIHPNPYLTFFRKKNILASIWRDVPSLLREKLSLRDKADVISNRIASEFINWLRENDLLADELHVKSLIEMFEIANEVHVSLQICQEELFTVPEPVAQFLGDMSRSKKVRLHKEIHRDYKASFRKPKMVAFGSTIPPHLQRKPSDRKQLHEWLKSGYIPRELETMEVVWKNIYNLKSTREFCHYLKANYPEITPPKCLVDSGAMDPRGRFSKVEKETSETLEVKVGLTSPPSRSFS
ncbi:hypothetical protein JTB14_013810 [Gonioctena quinquepunctata]|nr:hypothetical protein JTB14_013810 [Gonioctena quinquepunctata]